MVEWLMLNELLGGGKIMNGLSEVDSHSPNATPSEKASLPARALHFHLPAPRKETARPKCNK
jgi:hypothetical protein